MKYKQIVIVLAVATLSVSCFSRKISRPPPPAAQTQVPTTTDFVAAAGPQPTPLPAPKPSPTPKIPNPNPGPSPESPSPNPITSLDNCGSDFDCYQGYYQNLVQKGGVAGAFTDLKERYSKNAYIASQCHPLTHIIGQQAIAIYSSVGEAYVNGDGYCWSGYYHGVMEGIIGKVGRSNFLAGMNEYCKDIPGKAAYSFDYFNCVHGLGHGVMAFKSNELFDALKLCDILNGSWEQSSCQGGVFMENVIIDNKNHYTKFLKPDDLLYPCNAVDGKYKAQCYLMQTSYILKQNGGNFSNAFQLCSQADEGFSTTCYQSLGRDISSRNYNTISGIKRDCALGQSQDQESNCLVGAVKDVISYYHSDVQAKELCTLYEGNLKNICDSTTSTYYKNF